MEKVIVNNQMLNRSEVNIDVEDRGYQFGDGVYEVIRVYNGRLFTGKEHIDRLYESAKKIFLNIPFTIETITNNIEQLVKENKVQTGIIYMQITRGVSPRQHHFPGEDVAPTFVAYTREMPRPDELMNKGVKAMLAEDIRWLRCDIKSLNLLPNLLAKQKATEMGCYEAIQYRDKTVTEGSSSNIFIVHHGLLKTHPATNLILNGITRQVILQLCDKNDIAYEEETFTVSELLEADEVFMTSTTSEIIPIIQVDDKQIGNGKPGAITKQLLELLQEKINNDCHVKVEAN